MTGWNLPPGCTEADIDRAMGADNTCSICGEVSEELEIYQHKYVDKLVCPKCWPYEDY